MSSLADKQFLMTALPPAATILKVGYCKERKQTYIALKHSLHNRNFTPSDFRLIRVANKVKFLRIDVIGGSPDILFSDFNVAKHHEFYLPRRPKMDAIATTASDNDLTDQNVADLIQWAYKNQHLYPR